jgi:mannose-1-phosphate guanylyltransferase/phosphomannomutase
LYAHVDSQESAPNLPASLESLLAARVAMAAKLSMVRGALAVAIDNAAEELFILDSRGRPVGQAQLSTLLSYAELRKQRNTRLPVPVTATEAIFDLAKTFHGQVVRIKTQRRSILEELAATPPAMRGLILPAYDALAALARLLELLAEDGRALADIIDALPSYKQVETAVSCTWEAKGRLMRRLIEECRDRQVELTDGLRVQEENGWALILPDGEEPFIHVYSEAGTNEEADALNHFYVDKVRAIQREH